MTTRRIFIFPGIILLAVAGLIGCVRADEVPANHVVRVWCHQGQEAENNAMREIAAAFNAAHASSGIRVDLTFFPDFQYTEKLAIAAAARDLPDAFDLDGPLVARLVEARLLQPIDRWFGTQDRADFLPSILAQGTIGGRLYALGAFDSATVLYYDRAMLQNAGVVPPPGDAGWTWEEFLAACEKLKAAGMTPVSLHLDESADEWFTYAFSPVVWSGGGRLISADGRSVRGVLTSAANVRSVRAWQEVFRRGFAPTDPVDPDLFGHGKTAMDWSGHWLAPAHVRDKGGKLGVMPLPRTGPPYAAPCGSWCWGLAATARNADAAAEWLRWVTAARTGIEPIVRANGAVPARRSAFAAFPEYARAPFSLFRLQLETRAHPRPRTPYYAALTHGFAAALRDIAHGADVEPRLHMAEKEIQAVIDRRAGATEATEAPP